MDEIKRFYEQEAGREVFWAGTREEALVEQILGYMRWAPSVVLDAGCGNGYLLHCVKEHTGCRIFGLDVSRGRLKDVSVRLPAAFLTEGSIEKLPFRSGSFDTVIASQVLEHVPDYCAALDELVRVTGKYLIITVPNEQAPVKISCPRCNCEHFLDGHMHLFSGDRIKTLAAGYPQLRMRKLAFFSTIYTYNSLTWKLPRWMRMALDRRAAVLSRMIPFLKPNYILVILEKKQT